MTILLKKRKLNVTSALTITRRRTSLSKISRIKSIFREWRARRRLKKFRVNRTPSTVNSFTIFWWLTWWWGTQRMTPKVSRTFKRSWAKALLRLRLPQRSFSRSGPSTYYPIYIMEQVSFLLSTTLLSHSCTWSMEGGSGLASTFKNVSYFITLRTWQSSTKFYWRWNLPPTVYTIRWTNQFLRKTNDS